MAKAKQAFHWPDPVNPAFFDEGDPVPDEIAEQVGDHLVDRRRASSGGSGSGATADDIQEALRALLESGEYVSATEVQQQVDEAVEAAKAREQAAYDALADQEEPFDPSGDGQTAAKVKEYLQGLDVETVNGRAEYERVVELEREGQNRSTAIPD